MIEPFTPPQVVASIIHGARRLSSQTPNTRWMSDLEMHLRRRGVVPFLFKWSGGLVHGVTLRDASRYAEELRLRYRSAAASGAVLSIVAKSLGGAIAERALRLASEVKVDLFLRIGVPDARRDVFLPNVHRLVDVNSADDSLHRFGQVFSRLMFPPSPQIGYSNRCVVTLAGLSHAQLTNDHPIFATSIAASTYELYEKLLMSEA